MSGKYQIFVNYANYTIFKNYSNHILLNAHIIFIVYLDGGGEGRRILSLKAVVFRATYKDFPGGTQTLKIILRESIYHLLCYSY